MCVGAERQPTGESQSAHIATKSVLRMCGGTRRRIVGSGRDFAGHSRQSRWRHEAGPNAHGRIGIPELRVVTVRLDREGFTERPAWPELRHGKRPPVNTSCEPGEWLHSWQFWASSVSDAFFRKTSLSCRTAARRAHLRSHPGRNAGVALAHAPTTPECTVAPAVSCVACSKGCTFPCQSQKQCAVVGPRWTRMGNTELLVPSTAT